MSSVNSADNAQVDHSIMYLNNYVQKHKLTWLKDTNVIDEKKGLGWSATIYVDGKPYTSGEKYFKRKGDALVCAARNALITFGVDPATGK
ncbi:hypothetical protein FRB94_002943 [Tulasnella sp. JGI-2019a]|nr:hypothetical protein FRB93_013149 [Tulasnella sp. JGI-2019a]KAG9013415.1 hypothetical protein FRB94_002943 [Tulasnella sp. JGI-2019a]KAG9034746.1 hypothetical protein FRB95_012696 [Tulasnella sp. JGI-2019a]